jgi:hypothetical protein
MTTAGSGDGEREPSSASIQVGGCSRSVSGSPSSCRCRRVRPPPDGRRLVPTSLGRILIGASDLSLRVPTSLGRDVLGGPTVGWRMITRSKPADGDGERIVGARREGASSSSTLGVYLEGRRSCSTSERPAERASRGLGERRESPAPRSVGERPECALVCLDGEYSDGRCPTRERGGGEPASCSDSGG